MVHWSQWCIYAPVSYYSVLSLTSAFNYWFLRMTFHSFKKKGWIFSVCIQLSFMPCRSVGSSSYIFQKLRNFLLLSDASAIGMQQLISIEAFISISLSGPHRLHLWSHGDPNVQFNRTQMKPSTLVIPGGEGTLFPPAFNTTYTLTSEKQALIMKVSPVQFEPFAMKCVTVVWLISLFAISDWQTQEPDTNPLLSFSWSTECFQNEGVGVGEGWLRSNQRNVFFFCMINALSSCHGATLLYF